MSTIGVAIAGTGFMGWVHTEALRRAGLQVVGILGSTADKSRAAAERLQIPRVYATYAELLSDRQVAAVHIATPNRLHFEMARQALEAGKHVMCEKPLAMNSAESAQLVELASAHPHLAAGVNYNIRYYPLCLESKQRVRDGWLGELWHVNGSYLQDWLLDPSDYNWRVLADEGGSLRAVADIGTHWFDLAQSLTGLYVESVCADLSGRGPDVRRTIGQQRGSRADPGDDRGLWLHSVSLAGQCSRQSTRFAGQRGAQELFAVRNRRFARGAGLG
jgi:predicted dehydrogenase